MFVLDYEQDDALHCDYSSTPPKLTVAVLSSPVINTDDDSEKKLRTTTASGGGDGSSSSTFLSPTMNNSSLFDVPSIIPILPQSKSAFSQVRERSFSLVSEKEAKERVATKKIDRAKETLLSAENLLFDLEL